MASLGQLTIDLVAKIGGFVEGLSKAERQSKKFKDGVEKNLKATGVAFAALGIAGAAATAALIKASINNADALLEQSQAYGVSVESLSAYQLGLEKTGSSSAELAIGLKGLANAVDSDSDAFKRLQISTKDANGVLKSSDALLGEIADRFASMEDGITKTALAQDLLGKSGAKLIPFLNQGKAGLAAMREEAERLGLVISQETAEAADQFNDNLATLKATITGTGNELATALLPEMVEFTNTLNDPATQQGIKDIVTGLAQMAIHLTKIVTTLPNLTRFLSEELAAFTGGVAFGDLPRMEEELQEVKNNLNFANESTMFTASPELVAEWEAKKSRLEQEIALVYELAAAKKTVEDSKPAIPAPDAPGKTFVPAAVDDESSKTQETLNKLVKDRLDSYREQIILQGESTELAKLQADIELGKFQGASPQQLDELQGEAMYADSIAAEQELKKSIDERVASYGNVINALGEMSAVAQLNLEISQGAFPGATEEDLASLRKYAESVDAIAWAKKRREANEAFADMESGLQKQIDLLGNTSQAAELLYDIEHGGYEQFSEDQQGKLVLMAEELEAREQMLKEFQEQEELKAEIAKEFARNTQNILADFLKGSFDDGLKGAFQRFQQMLSDMAAEAVAADIMKWVFGGKKGATGESSTGGIFSAIGDIFGGGEKKGAESGGGLLDSIGGLFGGNKEKSAGIVEGEWDAAPKGKASPSGWDESPFDIARSVSGMFGGSSPGMDPSSISDPIVVAIKEYSCCYEGKDKDGLIGKGLSMAGGMIKGSVGTAISAISSFAGLFDNGGPIKAGEWGIVGENGPEIVKGPAMVASRVDTAKMLGGKDFERSMQSEKTNSNFSEISKIIQSNKSSQINNKQIQSILQSVKSGSSVSSEIARSIASAESSSEILRIVGGKDFRSESNKSESILSSEVLKSVESVKAIPWLQSVLERESNSTSDKSTETFLSSVRNSFAGMFDAGGTIGAGQWGIAGENGAEIIRGPASITSTKDTAAMMGKGSNTNITFNFPGVTNKQEAQQAGSAAARQFQRMNSATGRYN